MALFLALRLEPIVDTDLFFPNVRTDLEGTVIRAGTILIAKAPSGGSYGESRLRTGDALEVIVHSHLDLRDGPLLGREHRPIGGGQIL